MSESQPRQKTIQVRYYLSGELKNTVRPLDSRSDDLLEATASSENTVSENTVNSNELQKDLLISVLTEFANELGVLPAPDEYNTLLVFDVSTDFVDVALSSPAAVQEKAGLPSMELDPLRFYANIIEKVAGLSSFDDIPAELFSGARNDILNGLIRALITHYRYAIPHLASVKSSPNSHTQKLYKITPLPAPRMFLVNITKITEVLKQTPLSGKIEGIYSVLLEYLARVFKLSTAGNVTNLSAGWNNVLVYIEQKIKELSLSNTIKKQCMATIAAYNASISPENPAHPGLVL